MKTTFSYDHYWKYEELKNNILSLQDQYPSLLQVQINMTTPEGRNQYVLILTNQKTGDPLSKPGWYLDGNIHAGEVTASMTAMHLVDYLLTNYETKTECRKILDQKCVYVIPRVSPDGAEKYLSTPYSLRSVDRTYGGEKGGICGKDLDEDGVIRIMRIPSAYGSWKKDPDHPDRMVPRSPSDEEGDFFDLYPEGMLNAFDGDENLRTEKSDWGLDFNRNYPYGWFPEGRQTGSGKYPLSEPENKAIVDFVLAHPNIGGAALGHTQGGLILYEPGTRPSRKADPSDLKVIQAIAQMGQEELDYIPLNTFDSYIADEVNWDSGALDDWFYETQGIPAFTIEFWNVSRLAGVQDVYGTEASKEDLQAQIRRYEAIFAWAEENAPQYCMEWKTYEHPQFGKAEVGGFNYKFIYQNPPENYLLKTCEDDTRFNLRFLHTLPALVIDTLYAEEVERDIWKITCIVGNPSFLSTALTRQAEKMHVSSPVQVTIHGGRILAGKRTEEIEKLDGFSETVTGFDHGLMSTSQNSHARKKLSWLIKAERNSTVTVTARQVKAGEAERTIVLR